MHPRPPISTLFPYTTLFRSLQPGHGRAQGFDHLHPSRLFGPTFGVVPALGRLGLVAVGGDAVLGGLTDRKSTRLNSSHMSISYAVFCLKKKNHQIRPGSPDS